MNDALISGAGWSINESELEFSFIRSSGPGGQAVNKISSAVQLRFSVTQSSLPGWLKARVLALSDRRISQSGDVVIKAQTSRSREANQIDAISRLKELVEKAAHRPKTRRATKPTRASVRRRLDSKKKRSEVKSGRGSLKL
jgi:ribosome-associated protein